MTRVKTYSIKKAKNLYTGEAPRSLKDKSKNILIWGKNNDYPQELINTIYRSHTASACLDTYKTFLTGSGFSDKALNELMVNADQNMIQFHSCLTPDNTYFDGIAIRVLWTPQGKISSMRHMPFESVRLGIPDDKGNVNKLYYNPFYGTKDYEVRFTEEYDSFSTDPKVIREQIQAAGLFEWKGQILYLAAKKPMRRFYPEPSYSGAIKWFAVDNSIGEFHENNIDNNFLLSCLIKIAGDPNDAAEVDSEGKTVKTIGDAFDEEITHNMSGKDNAGKMMVLWAKTKEMFPELQAFPANTNDELFKTLQQLTIDNITIATKVPPIIAGIQVSGKLGNTAEIINSARLLQKVVSEKQEILETTYKMLLSYMEKPFTGEVKINKVTSLTGLDPAYISYLSNEEIRKYIAQEYGIELDQSAPVVEPQTEYQVLNSIFNGSESNYTKFYDVVNMTYKELDSWLSSDCSKKPGFSMEVPRKTLDILRLNKGDWDHVTESWAKRIINSIERIKSMEETKVFDGCGEKKNILLKNLGHNTNKL